MEDEGRQPIGGGGSPNPTPKGEPLAEKWPGPSTPSAGGDDKSGENAKERRLNWHSKCLQAAGVEINFLTRDGGAAPRITIWFSASA